MATVYWIQKEGDTDINSQGYVGYTARDPAIREKEWTRQGRVGTFHVIAEGSVDEMLSLERKLRPHSYIGDNTAPGGSIGGGEHERTAGTREKIRQSRIGETWGQDVKDKISAKLKGKMMWVTNGKDNKSIPTSDPIPAGYRRGRTITEAYNKRQVVWEGKTYESLTQAAEETGINISTLHAKLKKEQHVKSKLR